MPAPATPYLLIQGITPGYYISGKAHSNSVADPIEFMGAAGCRVLDDRGAPGGVVIPRPDSGFRVFSCDGLSKDSILTLSRVYRGLLVAAKLRGESVQEAAAGYWVQLGPSYNICWGEEGPASSYSGPDGVMHYVMGTLTTTCKAVTDYAFVWNPDIDPDEWYATNTPDGGGGSPTPWTDQPPPDTTRNVVLESLELSSNSITANAGDQDVGGLITTAHYSNGTSNQVFPAWRTADASVAIPDDDGRIDAIGAGTTAYTAQFEGLAATATVVVSAVCGANNDPNLVLTADGLAQPVACTPSPADLETYGPGCISTPDPNKCVAEKAAAYAGGSAACSYLIQRLECTEWLGKLLVGDTSAVQLSGAQWQSLVADTALSTALAPVTNAVNPDNGVTYPTARVWNYTATSWKYVVGSATIYYDSSGNPVAFHDDYNFYPDKGTGPFMATSKAFINDAAGGASFRVHYP